jgi:hypothetical protein
MSGTIKRIRHRHSDQNRDAPDLELAIGQPLPDFYQIGRPAGLVVIRIEGPNPYRCRLSNGDVIFVGDNSAREVTED